MFKYSACLYVSVDQLMSTSLEPKVSVPDLFSSRSTVFSSKAVKQNLEQKAGFEAEYQCCNTNMYDQLLITHFDTQLALASHPGHISSSHMAWIRVRTASCHIHINDQS